MLLLEPQMGRLRATGVRPSDVVYQNWWPESYAWQMKGVLSHDEWMKLHGRCFTIGNVRRPNASDLILLRRECCNEYYVLAARALAALRADTLQDDLW